MYDNDQKRIESLLESGINTPDENGKTPLMLAAWIGDTGLVKRILSQGADVDLEDELGETALGFSARGGNLKVLKLMIQSGADLNHKSSVDSLDVCGEKRSR